jgi:hypothetical protein
MTSYYAWTVLLSAATFAACSTATDEVETPVANPDEETAIIVGDFPTYRTNQTRAVNGAPEEPTAWTAGDIIYVQLNGSGPWYALTVNADRRWESTPTEVVTEELPTLKKTDTWKAVYAPNYEVTKSDDGTYSLQLKEGKMYGTAEYLTCSGQGKPIDIEFERNYSRVRIYTGKRNITVSLPNGSSMTPGVGIEKFQECDAEQIPQDATSPIDRISTLGATLEPDESGNFYLYGSWAEGMGMELTNALLPALSNYDYSVGNYIYCGLPNGSAQLAASVANTSYAVDYEAVTVDLDKAPAQAFFDSSTQSASSAWIQPYTDFTKKFRVIGTWSSDKALSFLCAEVTSIDMSNVSGMTEIPHDMCNSCEMLQTFQFPANVSVIGKSAFEGCPSLTVGTLPETLQTIGEYAFSKCIIAFSTLPSSVQSVADNVFYTAKFTQPFTWPATLSEIPEGTFEEASLTTITLPSSLTTIKKTAFKNCSQLSEVTCLAATPPSLDTNVFTGIVSGATLYVPSTAVDDYKASNWANYFGTIQAIASE